MTENTEQTNQAELTEPDLPSKPPILGSWPNLYKLVLGTLLGLMILFYLITILLS